VPEDLARLDRDGALDLLFRSGQEAGVLPPDITLDEVRQLFEVFRRNFRAALRYVPRPYAGRVVLFQAAASVEESWSALAPVEPHLTPGDHFTFLAEPLVQALAASVRGVLDEGR